MKRILAITVVVVALVVSTAVPASASIFSKKYPCGKGPTLVACGKYQTK